MRLSDLLLAMLRTAKKARDIARIIRCEPALLHLLVEEKKGLEKNKRFVQDFKTLADVLIQQMVAHDIASEFPEMKGSIFGEESNQFTNALGESTTIHLCDTQQQTSQLLKDILDDNEEAALLLSQVVHSKAETAPSIEHLDTLQHACMPSDDVGIWIDPIDSTAQYISGQEGQLDGSGVTSGGLQCVVVLIGAFQKSSGLPIVGVVSQPFWQLDQASQQWSDQTTWGVCYGDLHFASVLQSKEPPSSKSPVIIMSTSESDPVKQKLSQNFHLRFASGAGYKLLCTAQRRVEAYVLSKSSIYLWDCCAPHAILRAIGGGMVRFQDAIQQMKLNGCSETVKDLQVKYSVSSALSSGGKSIDGVIAYSCPEVLEKILQSMVGEPQP
ncbi:hypothetical protein ACOMHN_041726 [Nucella lapillus]